MSPTLLVALATVLLAIVKRFIEYREAVNSVGNSPGFRTLLSIHGVFNNFVTTFPIPGITLGAFRAWKAKHSDFEYFGVDIVSHVSAFPRVWRTFYIADAAVLKEITTHRARFPKPVEQYGSLTFFGNNIVTSEGDEWKKYRKIVQPAFSEPNNRLVWEETARIMNSLFDDEWGSQGEIVYDHIVDFTLPIALFIIGAAGFGRRVSWKDEDSISEGHSMSFKHALHLVSTGIIQKAAFPDWLLKHAPSKRLRDIRTAYEELERYMMEMCRARLGVETKEERHDLFSNLLDANDLEAHGATKLTDRELLGNIFIFLLAGHETTAHTLCFTFAFLALYPEEQDKLYQHIKSVLPDGRTPTYEDMNSLKYTEAVLYETLRLVPPVVGIPKTSAAEDTAFTTQNSAGETVVVPVPRGSSIVIHTPGLHYNPRYWEDPHSFKPSRFLGDWPRDAFLPFSGGARSCIGRRFFETESIAIVTMLILRYKIELKDEPEYAHESFEEKKARLLTCKQAVTTTPVKLPLTFLKRQ